MDLRGEQSVDYEYIDSGGGARLERFGEHVFDRPSPQAIWPREQPARWAEAAGRYHRSSSGGGSWEFLRALPDRWPVRFGPCRMLVKPTGFGHMGLFPEHSCHWPWLRERIAGSRGGCRVLHLFAYTGAMTLVAAEAGAEVCHVDSVADINAWARQNAAHSGMEKAPVRWITDDALKFAARETRRGRRYEGVILDPPTYGKGPDGERWLLEEKVGGLLEVLLTLMEARPRFILFTCHTPGFSPPLMANLLDAWPRRFGGALEAGHMTLTNQACRCVLPVGVYARWRCKD